MRWAGRRELTLEYEEGGPKIQDIEVKIMAMRIKHLSEAIDKDRFPLVEYFLGIDLTRFTLLNNGLPHYFRKINSPFHQELTKAIAKYPDQIRDMKPYLAILPKPTRPIYEKLKCKVMVNSRRRRDTCRSSLTQLDRNPTNNPPEE